MGQLPQPRPGWVTGLVEIRGESVGGGGGGGSWPHISVAFMFVCHGINSANSVLCWWTWYNVLWPTGFQLSGGLTKLTKNR